MTQLLFIEEGARIKREPTIILASYTSPAKKEVTLRINLDSVGGRKLLHRTAVWAASNRITVTLTAA